MSNTAGGGRHEVDWRSARIPEGASWINYRCGECGHRITVSPRASQDSTPSLYCGECSNGPPLSKYAVEFNDGTVKKKPGAQDQEVPGWGDSDE